MRTMQPVTFFYCYARKDKDLRDELDRHLSILRRSGQIQSWYDLDISAGVEWEKELDAHLNTDQVILLLISPDFMASDYCYSKEMKRAIERHHTGEALVIPILMRSVFWEGAPFSKLQMLPTDAKAITLWPDRDMAFENVVRGIQKAIENLITKSPVISFMRTIEFSIQQGDITTFDADVLALKYAQEFYGTDEIIAGYLSRVGIPIESLCPAAGDYRYVNTQNCIQARHVLFVGTVDIAVFDYRHIRELASTILNVLVHKAPNTHHLAMTIHGAGFGLDEVEAFFSQFAGFIDVIQNGRLPQALEYITIIDRHPDRVQRLRQAVEQNLTENEYISRVEGRWAYRFTVQSQKLPKFPISNQVMFGAIESAGRELEVKPYIFVGMSLKKGMEDVFYYGIQGPVRNAGFLCERVDQEVFIGDAFEQMKKKIEAATVVVVELSEADPTVYLEVGYAWGKGCPTILLVKSEQGLRFDLGGQRFIKYESIRGLEEALSRELAKYKH